MRRVLLAVSFWLLALGFVNAQEAFYIYRNDGDFNGFFYDEVIEMRQSKIGVDSVEYDRWVTQEVVLADTIYRIPLGAIDSIGFQQPEIRLNPNIKFVEREGYSPYLQYWWGRVSFVDMPESMAPQVGDVLIGLPTDACADEYGSWGGSFALIVESLEKEGNKLFVNGREVTQISDVFDQYVTVEQIGVDQQGNIRRRIAGCTPDGFPRKAPTASGEGQLTLIDFAGTLSREWEDSWTTTKIDLTADVGIKLIMRAAYNITWKRFYVKLSRDFIANVKPTIGASLSSSFEGSMGEIVGLPPILFPAACPVFQTQPRPDIFLRAEGKVEARFNMPKVQIGISDDMIMDSKNLFPITYGLHLTPDEDKEVPTEMLDLSINAKFSGYVQTGVEFVANLATASWFKKVLMTDISLHLYVGPKLNGEIKLYDSGYDNNQTSYFYLSHANINYSLLSLDLEAKATAAAFWQDPAERTFFNKNWSFICDTFRLAPVFKEPTIEVRENDVRVVLNTEGSKILSYTKLQVGLCDHYDNAKSQPSLLYGNWTMFDTRNEKYEVSIPLSDLKAQRYYVGAVVTPGPFGTYFSPDVLLHDHFFVPPFKINLAQDSLVFDCQGNQTKSVDFTTNCPTGGIFIHGNSWWCDKDTLIILDEQLGKYRAVFRSRPNTTLFSMSSPKSANHLEIYLQSSGLTQTVPVGFYLKAPNQNVATITPNVYARFNYQYYDETTEQYEERRAYVNFYNSNITIQRNGEDELHMEGSYVETQMNGDITATNHLEMDVRRDPNNPKSDKYIYTNGKCTKIEVNTCSSNPITETTVIYFESDPNNQNTPKVTSGTTDIVKTKGDGTQETSHYSMQEGFDSIVDVNYWVSYNQ